MSRFIENAWYVAAFSEECTDKPLSRRILGISVVFFRTADQRVMNEHPEARPKGIQADKALNLVRFMHQRLLKQEHDASGTATADACQTLADGD